MIINSLNYCLQSLFVSIIFYVLYFKTGDIDYIKHYVLLYPLQLLYVNYVTSFNICTHNLPIRRNLNKNDTDTILFSSMVVTSFLGIILFILKDSLAEYINIILSSLFDVQSNLQILNLSIIIFTFYAIVNCLSSILILNNQSMISLLLNISISCIIIFNIIFVTENMNNMIFTFVFSFTVIIFIYYIYKLNGNLKLLLKYFILIKNDFSLVITRVIIELLYFVLALTTVSNVSVDETYIISLSLGYLILDPLWDSQSFINDLYMINKLKDDSKDKESILQVIFTCTATLLIVTALAYPTGLLKIFTLDLIIIELISYYSSCIAEYINNIFYSEFEERYVIIATIISQIVAILSSVLINYAYASEIGYIVSYILNVLFFFILCKYQTKHSK